METPRDELIRKVKDHVLRYYGGDWTLMFPKYDSDNDGKVSRDELLRLLADCGVGNFMTRPLWGSRVLQELDLDKDGGISQQEITSALQK